MKKQELFFCLFFLFPFLLTAQFGDCESAIDNINCDSNINGSGVVSAFNLDFYAFTGTEDGEVAISYFWECVEDGTGIDEFLDVYVIVREGCGGAADQLFPGCDGGPLGEEGTFIDVEEGVDYVVEVHTCEGFECEYEIFINGIGNGGSSSVQFELLEPVFEDGCSEPDILGANEFCTSKEIVFETSEEYFFPVHNWTINCLSGNCDVDDILWSDDIGNSGNGGDLELYESSPYVRINFPTDGVFEVCIEEVEVTCVIYESDCVEITIIPEYRHFEESVCITDIINGWLPDESQDGYAWIGDLVTLDDLSNNGSYVEREVFSSGCDCYFYQDIEFEMSYPGDNGECSDPPINNCPEWQNGLTLYLNGTQVSQNDVDFLLDENWQLEVRIDETDLPAAGIINWYKGYESGFDPLNEGALIGSSEISSTEQPCSAKPELLGIMFDGPESYVLEDDNSVETEYMIIGTGSGFDLDELFLDVENNCDASCPSNCFDGVFGRDCGWNGDATHLFDLDETLVGVGSGDAVPANSFLIVLLGPADPDVLWTESYLNTDECIYITQSDCSRCLGAFRNDGGAVDYSITTDCGESTLSYDPGNFGEGSYATRESYQSRIANNEIPAVWMESYQPSTRVQPFVYNPRCADKQEGNPVIYIQGVLTVGGQELACCSATPPTISLYVGDECDENPGTTLAWGSNSSSFLPPDFTISTTDCPFIFGGSTYYDDSGRSWNTVDMVAMSTCPTPGVIQYGVSRNPSSNFPEGETVVSLTASDACNNMIKHEFTITVICQDVTPPPPPNDPVFEDFPWLDNVVDVQDCEGTIVEVYQLGIYNYIYVTTTDGAQLYFQDGSLYCTDSPNFNCVDAYGLTDLTQVYVCDDSTVPPPSGPNPSDDYPWMTEYIDFDDCEGLTIFFYDFSGRMFPYFEVDGRMKLFSNTGQLYCTDNPPGFICPEVYGLGAPVASWTCGAGCNCPTVYDPVCGSDGVTYSNACEANCAGVDVATLGECETGTVPGIFMDYPWLSDVVDPFDCTPGAIVQVYRSGIYNYIYYDESLLIPGKLYNAQGQFYCEDSPGFSCLSAYGLESSDFVAEWACGIIDYDCPLSLDDLFCESWFKTVLATYPNCSSQLGFTSVNSLTSATGNVLIHFQNCFAADGCEGEVYSCDGTKMGTSMTTFGGISFDPPELIDHEYVTGYNCATGFPVCLLEGEKVEDRSRADSNKMEFNCYPNPSTGIVTIKLDEEPEVKAEISVYDLSGKRIISQNITQQLMTLDLTDQTKGVYLIEILNGSERVVRKLILI